MHLAYGKGVLRARVNEALAPPEAFLATRAPAALEPAALYRDAVAAADWSDLADPVAVVVPDGTRPAARPAALATLETVLAGRDILVVVGAGLHPADTIDAPWPVHVHDARAGDLVPVGEAAGVPVRLHPVAARAASVVVVGTVLPHYLAGFSGGPKGIVPGVAAEETILGVHASGDMPAAIRAAAARLPGRAWSVNLLVGPRGPFAATAGPLLAAHDEAVARFVAACAQPRPEPADVVVADTGGHPVDATLLQTHKAYEAAARLVRDGGTVILVACCDEGFGHPEFERRLRVDDPLAGPFHPYARTAAAWRAKTRRTRTRMVTGMDVAGLGVERVELQEALDDIPPGSRVLFATRAQDLLFE